MIAKTEGIVLRVFPYSETSRVISWLTRDVGRLTTLVKGAVRPKSPALGQFDLFYTCEVLYYEKENHNLHVLRECSPLHLRSGFREDWRACAAASYFAGLLRRLSPPGAAQINLYAYLRNLLDALVEQTPQATSLYWAELRLLHHLGLSPRLDTCRGCGRHRADLGRPVSFHVDQGRFLCQHCHTHADDGNAVHVPPDALAPLGAWQRAGNMGMARATRCSGEAMRAIHELLGRFLTYHLELPPHGRDIAFRLLASSPGVAERHA